MSDETMSPLSQEEGLRLAFEAASKSNVVLADALSLIVESFEAWREELTQKEWNDFCKAVAAGRKQLERIVHPMNVRTGGTT